MIAESVVSGSEIVYMEERVEPMAAGVNVYQEIAERTGGDIYLGVVGPVRTGKSTFVKRMMQTLVIPNIQDMYQRERARDELPQSSSGRTIMTSEPKFVPEEAVQFSPDGTATLSVRLIDSVGYMVPGALGSEEDGTPRLVTTPWYPEPIPMAEAGELGTKKIMEEHCTIGVLITTDGSIHEIPRENYVEAETRAIEDMKRTGKPFLVLVNSTEPESEAAQTIRTELEQKFQVRCLCVNCLTMEEKELQRILSAILYEFPVGQIQIYMPGWMRAMPFEHPVKAELFASMMEQAAQIQTLSQAEPALSSLCRLETVESFRIRSVDPGTGTVVCELGLPERLFYQILAERSALPIENDADLMDQLVQLSQMKCAYEKISSALDEAQTTGYGIVMPSSDEIRVELPEVVRKGGHYGVRLKARAPSIHMLRADIETELHPMVGDEKQSEELRNYLLQAYDEGEKQFRESRIFGKSVDELVNDGLISKLTRMPNSARYKLKDTLSRVINEESNGLLCIIWT